MGAKEDTFLDEPNYERDAGKEPLSQTVVMAVADAKKRAPTDLPPLHDVLDPDALDTLFADTIDGRTRPGGHLTFEYCDCDVAILGKEKGKRKVVVDSDI